VSSGDASPAGKVYEQLVGAHVAAEFDRKKTLEGRGTTILTTSGSLLTLIFGLTVVVSGKDAKFGNHWAVLLLMAALLAFVVSAVIAIFIAIKVASQERCKSSDVDSAHLRS
jgi:hypothetical protein